MSFSICQYVIEEVDGALSFPCLVFLFRKWTTYVHKNNICSLCTDYEHVPSSTTTLSSSLAKDPSAVR